MQFVHSQKLSPEILKSKIEAHIPGADVMVADLTGTSSNFAVDVVSSTFAGKSKIQQHRLVYEALGPEMKEQIHALQIRTSAS